MEISKIDILNKKFSSTLIGYSKHDVEIFLQDLADYVGFLSEHNMNLEKSVKVLEEKLDEYKSREEILKDTLLSTQKMTDDIKSNAQKQGKLIIRESQAKAEDILRHAHKRLAQIHEDISELKKQRAHFEIKLRSMIESHLKLLDSQDEANDRLEEAESKLKFLSKA
ncbi:DivIVA domain-containing protein [Desulfonatronovibrio magnus]|uniref:DivIVA domain-containing protein n=1 Tax=Desulfonatronovibrio magnus TaxID=698827 RepID=UPI0005EB4C34|nr:DivIVA domain-containing protein [Desulfonatronovibrio magnus]RQD66770.1 MAG: DivIVA domain-containing protein [Desulfonatronovibrio sp. MSAO_Bac4]